MNKFWFVCWTTAVVCTWSSAMAQQQSCVTDEALKEIDKWPVCKLTKVLDGQSGPMILSGSPDYGFCAVEISDALEGVSVDAAKDGVTDSADKACAIKKTSDDGKPRLAVRLPKAGIGPLWEVKGRGAATSVQASATERGFELTKTQPRVVKYDIGVAEAQLNLATPETLSTTYGTPVIKGVVPADKAIKHEGLNLVVPVSALTKLAKLQVTITNEYGQSEVLNLSLVPKDGYADSPSLQSMKIELAHVRKLAADEKYMRKKAGDDGKLSEIDAKLMLALYKAARDSLPACFGNACDNLNRAQMATIRLLRADIDYRSLLLEKRITFWGGFFTLRPTTPHHELIKMRELMAKFRQANDRMERWQFHKAEKDDRAKQIDSEKTYIRGQIEAQKLTVGIGVIETQRWQRMRASNDMTKKAVEQEISNVANRMEQLAQQQEALGKQATAQAMNIAASVTGLPVETVTAVAEGDLKAAVIKYVTSEIANPSSLLSNELKGFGDSLVGANGTLATLQESYKTVQDLRDKVDVVAVSIREPSLERFLKVGELAYANMGEKQKQQIDQLIDSQKPVRAWLQSSYHTVVAVRGEIDGYRSMLHQVTKELNNLPRTVNAEARRFLKQELMKVNNEGEQAIRANAARMLDGLKELQLTGRTAEMALVSALEAYPTFVAEINPDLWYSVKARYPSLGDQELVAQFQSAAKASLSMSRSEREAWVRKTGFGFGNDGKLVIENSGQFKNFDIGGDILRKSGRVNPARIQLSVQAQLESLIDVVSDDVTSARLMSFVASAASAEGATTFITRFIDNNRVPSIWNNLKNSSADLKAAVAPGVRHAMAASIASPGLPRPSIPSVSAGPSIPSSSPQEQMQNQMAAMALNAAFPGAGAALQLAQTFAAMDANRELNAMLNQQSAQLISAYQQLLRSSEQADFNESISHKESDRAAALYEAATEQMALYNSALDSILDATRNVDVRLRVYRPYFFYLAEMMRQRFDSFDRSLAMWSGAPDSRGFFASRIATDPSLARLALDSEIHLFDWLNRDREATKTDPFLLYVHWEQMLSLAESYCSDYGCKPGDNLLGQIGTTSRIGVFEKLTTPGTREKFDRWKRGSMSENFVFRVVLDPSSPEVPVNHLNVRNLDWNILPVSRNGTLAGTHVEVQHMGDAQIPYEQRLDGATVLRMRTESMLANSYKPSNREQRFDAIALASRFQGQIDTVTLQPLRGLEGWGLYGAYELTIAPNRSLREVEDFEIEIAYIYTNSRNITSEHGFIAASTAGSTDCGKDKDEAVAASACRHIYYFAMDNCSKTPSTASHSWLQPSAGLEFLYASQMSDPKQKLKLCQATASVPLVQRAMEHQSVSHECNWAAAVADIRKLDSDGMKAVMICKDQKEQVQ